MKWTTARLRNRVLSNPFGLIEIVIAIAVITAISLSVTRFYHVVHDASVSEGPAPLHIDTPSASTSDIQVIANAGWFGTAPQPQSGPANTIDLRARFELKGASQSDDVNLAGAYIAEKGKAEHYYRQGDALPDNAGTLQEVFTDHVLIHSGASQSELRFDNSRNKPPMP